MDYHGHSWWTTVTTTIDNALVPMHAQNQGRRLEFSELAVFVQGFGYYHWVVLLYALVRLIMDICQLIYFVLVKGKDVLELVSVWWAGLSLIGAVSGGVDDAYADADAGGGVDAVDDDDVIFDVGEDDLLAGAGSLPPPVGPQAVLTQRQPPAPPVGPPACAPQPQAKVYVTKAVFRSSKWHKHINGRSLYSSRVELEYCAHCLELDNKKSD